MIPAVIWSDSTTKPERVETYIARAYYEHPDARVKNPKGALEFWPVGKYPENYKELLDSDEVQPFYPHPNIRDGERSTKYLGKGPQFMGFTIVPISDPIEAWEKYTPLLNKNAKMDRPPVGTIVRDDENFTLYSRNSAPRDTVGARSLCRIISIRTVFAGLYRAC